MFKSELVRMLSKKLPDLEATDVELAVNCMLEQMMTAIESGERIEVRGFGSFDLRHQPARTARNPKSGESVSILAKVKLHFKPGKEMRDRVCATKKNEPGSVKGKNG